MICNIINFAQILTPWGWEHHINHNAGKDRGSALGKIMADDKNYNAKRPKYSVSAAARASVAVENSRVANKNWAERRKEMRQNAVQGETWKRETHSLPRPQARAYARKFLKKYPKAAYWSEIESWRVLPGDVIEFTMRRLPSAD